MNNIFGYSWEEIQAMQQGTYDRPRAVHSPLPIATDKDRELLSLHGIEGLQELGLMGVVDRLSRDGGSNRRGDKQ